MKKLYHIIMWSTWFVWCHYWKSSYMTIYAQLMLRIHTHTYIPPPHTHTHTHTHTYLQKLMIVKRMPPYVGSDVHQLTLRGIKGADLSLSGSSSMIEAVKDDQLSVGEGKSKAASMSVSRRRGKRGRGGRKVTAANVGALEFSASSSSSEWFRVW